MSRPAAQTEAVLFDLGNVVLDLDPFQVFAYWAEVGATDTDTLMQRWALDDAYKRHEVGEIDFQEYTGHLAARLQIDLSLDDWRRGWNALFIAEYTDVTERLPILARQLPCFCFTNTNPTHQSAWQRRFGPTLAAFEKIYVSSDIGRRKPDVESFEWVAADMGFPPGTIHFIDDNRENVDGARRAGMRATFASKPDQVRAVMDVLLC